LDFEISESIGVLSGGDNSQELLQVLLLEVFLGQILQVSLGEWDFRFDNNGFFVHGDGDVGSEVTGLSFDLDLLGEEGFEILKNDNVILNWESAIDGILEG
tara:strand:+ start:282 stop:584 length:303 start_codon:yes stop_codon:yes gene_type:complete